MQKEWLAFSLCFGLPRASQSWLGADLCLGQFVAKAGFFGLNEKLAALLLFLAGLQATCKARCWSSRIFETYDLSVAAEIRRDDPLNLSISLSGGKETNKDSLSNGE